jgi:hypothetical protein
LSEEEMAVIRTHAAIGERILADSSCELIQLGAQIASSHHERWDGAGYPDGLKDTAIPIAARVVAVADVFDALTTRRPYKEPTALEVARDYLVEQSGRVRPRLRRRLPVALGGRRFHRNRPERDAVPEARATRAHHRGYQARVPSDLPETCPAK